MRPPGEALIAYPTGKRGINGHAIARRQPPYGGAGLQHGGRTFVSKRGWVLHDLIADAAFEIVVDIGAANSNAVDLQQDVAGPLDSRLGGVEQFDAAKGCKTGDFHGS